MFVLICINCSEDSEQTTSLRRLPLIEEESFQSSSESDQLTLGSSCTLHNSPDSKAPEFLELDLFLSQSTLPLKEPLKSANNSNTGPTAESVFSLHSAASCPQINVLPPTPDVNIFRSSHLIIAQNMIKLDVFLLQKILN